MLWTVAMFAFVSGFVSPSELASIAGAAFENDSPTFSV
jgi:hypothetical protein